MSCFVQLLFLYCWANQLKTAFSNETWAENLSRQSLNKQTMKSQAVAVTGSVPQGCQDWVFCSSSGIFLMIAKQLL